MLSPRILRNSLKAGVSSLFPNNSSSDVWEDEEQKEYRDRIVCKISDGESGLHTEMINKLVHLSKLLVDDSKFEDVVDLMFIVRHHQLGSL